jgi:hypothetical protein
MANLDSQLTQTLQDDKRLIFTASEKTKLEDKKDVTDKISQVTNAAQMVRAHRAEIHTVLAMLTITSGGALFPITAGIAGVLMLIDPIIETVGAYSDVALQFQLIFEYCVTFNKMFQVLSRMLYLITIFSKNRKHFKLLMYQDILEVIKEGRARSKLETFRRDQEASDVASKEVSTIIKIGQIGEVVKSPPEELSPEAIQDAIEKLQKWKEQGYDEAPDTIASGAIFPHSIYEKIKGSLDDIFKLLIVNVDSRQLQILINLDVKNMFGFREEQVKRNKYGTFFTKPDIIRRWQVAGKKNGIFSTLNESVNHISAGLLLMKLHIDTLFMYVEQHCTPDELNLLHIAVTTSPEFIAYIEPGYDMEVILASRAMAQLKLVNSSIIRDLGNDPTLDQQKSVEETIEQVSADVKDEVKQLGIGQEPVQVPVIAPVVMNPGPVTDHIMATAVPLAPPKPIRRGKVAPAPQEGVPVLTRKKPWYRIWGGSKTRRRRRRGGVSLRRRGSAI